jgi:hypothetical protein
LIAPNHIDFGTPSKNYTEDVMKNTGKKAKAKATSRLFDRAILGDMQQALDLITNVNVSSIDASFDVLWAAPTRFCTKPSMGAKTAPQGKREAYENFNCG